MTSSASAQDLIDCLSVRGPMSSASASKALGISQSTFSRLVRRCGDAILVAGKARATRYAARRQITGLGDRVPIYAVDAVTDLGRRP